MDSSQARSSKLTPDTRPLNADAQRRLQDIQALQFSKWPEGILGYQAALINALQDPDKDVRIGAAKGLIGGVNVALGAPELIMALDDQDYEVRLVAALVLGGGGVRAQSALPILLAALQTEDIGLRSRVINALVSISPQADIVLPILLEAIKDLDPNLRSSAVNSLGFLIQRFQLVSAVPTLIELLGDSDAGVRACTADSLGNLIQRLQLRSAVPALSEALKDPVENVRATTVLAMVRIGALAADAVPALIVALKRDLSTVSDEVPESISSGAENALGKIARKAPETIPLLIAALKDVHPSVRCGAVSALGCALPANPEYIPSCLTDLKALLNDENVHVRSATAMYFSVLGHQAKSAISDLQKVADSDPNLFVRNKAEQAIERLSVAQPPAVEPVWKVELTIQETKYEEYTMEQLLACLKDPDPRRRSSSALYLCRKGIATKSIVPTLLVDLEGADAGRRLLAVMILASLISHTEIVLLPALQLASQKETDPLVQEWLTVAIRRVNTSTQDNPTTSPSIGDM